MRKKTPLEENTSHAQIQNGKPSLADFPRLTLRVLCGGALLPLCVSNIHILVEKLENKKRE